MTVLKLYRTNDQNISTKRKTQVEILRLFPPFFPFLKFYEAHLFPLHILDIH